MSEAASAVLSNPAANPATQPDAEPSADQSARSRVSELRVSGHLMTLEHGVFCVFPAPARAPAAAIQPIVPGEDPEVIAHIQQTGDVGGTLGEWMGKRDSKLWIEGFGLKPKDLIKPSDIEYQAVLGRGWLSPWVDGGNFCGSRGMALPLLGINIRLKGDAADDYECHYSATFVDGTAVGPTPGGQACEAESLAALEAFQVEIRPLGAAESQVPAARKQAATRTAAAKSPAKPKAPARTTRR